jgi:hypothetical protein
VLFFAGEADAEAEADVELFLVAEAALFFDVALVVDAVVVVCTVSFFWVWQPRNAVSVSTVIKDKTDVFILVKLTKVEDV